MHYKNIHINMCGQDLTKTRVTRSMVIRGLESNKRYQIVRTWRGSMSMNVTLVLFKLSSSYIRSTKQFIHFLSLSQKAIMVLIMLELHKPFWVLIYFTHVALFLNNCLWVSFAHVPNRLLASCVLATLPSLYSWCSPSSRSWCFSEFLLLF